MNGKVKVVRKRPFSLHHALIREAGAAVKHAKEKLPGYGDRPLTAIILCCHAIEAICNAVGDRVVTDWKAFERTSPSAKLWSLCELLNVKHDNNQEPWSTVLWLLRQRNAIAHAKPQRVEITHVWSRDEYDHRRLDDPISDLERQLTLGNAKRSLGATKEVLLRLTEVIPDEDSFGLYSDSWEGSASAMNDD
jgi:hypothetical protein